MQTPFGLPVEHDFVHLTLYHVKVEDGALGMQEPYHQAVGIEGVVVGEHIAGGDGQVHRPIAEIGTHDVARHLIVAHGVNPFH